MTVMRVARMDVLLPTQEQVAVLSACANEVRKAGIRTIVPPFASLAQVQDKVAAFTTLNTVGLPQPQGAVLTSPRAVLDWERFPVYMKLPIGTATNGVTLVRERSQLADAVGQASGAAAFACGGVLAQLPAAGALAMVQSVFGGGELVAFHANLRVREGVRGGASHKRSVNLPPVRDHIERLGRHLAWHGALSADVILTSDGPVFIDINPRLVEPGNARRAGVDLVTPLVELANHRPTAAQPLGQEGWQHTSSCSPSSARPSTVAAGSLCSES